MADSNDVLIRPPDVVRNSTLPWIQATLGLLLTAVAGAQIVARIYDDSTHGDPVLIGLAVAQGLCGLALAAVGLLYRHVLRTARVGLTRDGLVHRQLRDRLIPWATIANIETIRRGAHWRLRLILTDGRRVTLVAPLTRTTMPAPHFAVQRDTILDWWQRNSGHHP